jgi:hypothetical protein
MQSYHTQSLRQVSCPTGPLSVAVLSRLTRLTRATIRGILHHTPRRDRATAGELARGMVASLADQMTRWQGRKFRGISRHWPIASTSENLSTGGHANEKPHDLVTDRGALIRRDPPRAVRPGGSYRSPNEPRSAT